MKRILMYPIALGIVVLLGFAPVAEAATENVRKCEQI